MPQHALVVDDDLETCELIQAILHSADMEALILTDSARAVELLRNQRFDAVFLDVNMPSPDGIEVTRLMRASGRNQNTPVIVVTGEQDPSVLGRAFQAGATFCLFKPINKARLLNLSRATHSAVERERRHYQRVVVNRTVHLLCEGDTLEGQTIDISLNGLLVRAPRTFAIGCHVSVRLFLTPDAPPIAAEATVVRVAAPQMGIHLERIGPDTSKRLQDFLLPLILAEARPQVDLND
ncbi:MAG: response regulator [Candidatus Acidiferrales bacterium]